jgi:hypothetical protein
MRTRSVRGLAQHEVGRMLEGEEGWGQGHHCAVSIGGAAQMQHDQVTGVLRLRRAPE